MDTGVEGRKASRVGVRVSAVSKTIKGNRVLDGVSASFPLARVSGIRGTTGRARRCFCGRLQE